MKPTSRVTLVWFELPLAAYFSPQQLDELNTIDNIRGVGDVPVPEGWFRSARIGRNRRDSRTQGSNTPSSEAPSPTSTSPSLSFHPLPSSHLRHPSSSHFSTSPTPSGYLSPAPSSPPHIPHQTSHHSMGQLVPLEVLVRTSGPRRDPVDEQLLRRFSS